MKIKTTLVSPALGTIVKYFVLMLVALFTIQTLFHIFISANPLEPASYKWWLSMLMLALGTSIGVAFGGRKVRLTLNEVGDRKEFTEQVIKSLKKAGLTVIRNTEAEIVFASSKFFNKLFSNWFGAELVTIKEGANEIEIEGPYRFVASIDSTWKIADPR